MVNYLYNQFIIHYLFIFFKAKLERSDFLGICGIIAEFNPLHTGHKYLINEAKRYGSVVCVLSGNFVQRGDTAIIDKRKRALAALRCGVDLVLELPVIWSMSTAQNFALGSVAALKAAGCDTLIFGSESGDVKKLLETAEILLSDEFSKKIAKKLKSGQSFAKLRQAVAEELGAEKGILDGANNNLAIEYIIAAKKLDFCCEFKTVKRLGAKHDSLLEDSFVSASFLREKLKSGDFKTAEKYIPPEQFSLINKDDISDIASLDKAILSKLRTLSLEELKKLPDLSEGIENKLFFAISVAENLASLYNEAKTKRYTEARIRRLVLSAFLGIDSEFFMKAPPYIRVLGFSKRAGGLLKNGGDIPIVSTIAQIKALDEASQKVFETECRASDLYGLSVPKVIPSGQEYKAKIIKTE